MLLLNKGFDLEINMFLNLEVDLIIVHFILCIDFDILILILCCYTIKFFVRYFIFILELF